MRKIEKNRRSEQEIITIPEDVTIDLGDREVILEAGDRIQLLNKKKEWIEGSSETINFDVEGGVNPITGKDYKETVSVTFHRGTVSGPQLEDFKEDFRGYLSDFIEHYVDFVGNDVVVWGFIK